MKITTWIDKTAPMQHKKDNLDRQNSTSAAKKDNLDRQNSTSAA
jgi:hypothetical protein